jgi:hypothetical protein
MSQIRELAGCSKRIVGQVLMQLEREMLVEKTTITKPAGKSNREYEGWKPRPQLLVIRKGPTPPSTPSPAAGSDVEKGAQEVSAGEEDQTGSSNSTEGSVGVE